MRWKTRRVANVVNFGSCDDEARNGDFCVRFFFETTDRDEPNRRNLRRLRFCRRRGHPSATRSSARRTLRRIIPRFSRLRKGASNRDGCRRRKARKSSLCNDCSVFSAKFSGIFQNIFSGGTSGVSPLVDAAKTTVIMLSKSHANYCHY